MSVFFITGMGRSGSLFMSKLLNKADNALVVHETPEDRHACIEGYWCPNKSLSVNRIMMVGEMMSSAPIYGEVSSYLRYHPLFLKYAFEAEVFHLVRDGRNVVRSMMNRRPFTKKDENHTGRIFPKLGDPFYYRWNKFSRFQKICWYWNDTVMGLLRYHIPLLKFERILESYEYLHERLLSKINLNLSWEDWDQEIHKKQNVNASYEFPDYRQWDLEHKAQFEEICGETMEILKY